VLAGAGLVVVRVASAVTASVTTPLLLDALALGASPDAQLTCLGTVPMPMLPPGEPEQMRLTVAGTDTRWGGLSRSGDGSLLVVAGVDAAAGAAWSTSRRTVGTLRFDGAIDVSASFNASMYSTGIFGAASVDGSGFWAVGGAPLITTRGVWYIPARGTSFRNTSIVWQAGGSDGWVSVQVGGQPLRLMATYAITTTANAFLALTTVGTNANLPTRNGQGGAVIAMPQPSGHRYRGSSIIANTLFAIAEETQGGIDVHRWSGTAWIRDATHYPIPRLADRTPVGVVLTGVTAFVSTATGRIFAFDTAARTWLNNGDPVYTAPAGFGLRGLALAPAAPSASPSPSLSSSPSATASATRTALSTGTPTRSASATATVTATASRSLSATASESSAPSNSGTPSATATETGSNTGSPTASLTGTPSSSGSRTGTPEPTRTRTGTPSASTTATGSVSASPSETSSVSETATPTASSSASQSGTPSSSATETGSSSSSQTATASSSETTTGTGTPSASGTGTSSVTAASTGTGTPAATLSGTPASTASKTRVPLPSASATRTKVRV